jgi:hypothetical protein
VLGRFQVLALEEKHQRLGGVPIGER